MTTPVLGFSICIRKFFDAPALAQTKRCTCDFADSKWEAYGTKAVCATFMHKGRTSCEVKFGGAALGGRFNRPNARGFSRRVPLGSD
jgi:hypothetical protein